jgi:DNA polymerase (family X)
MPWLNEEVAGLSREYAELTQITARDAGLVFAIDSDAHSVADQGNLSYGIGTAQRGWLTPDDVINSWPLARLRAFLRKVR